jgi:DNA-directed RNA polymerase specialized sigma24 family protein
MTDERDRAVALSKGKPRKEFACPSTPRDLLGGDKGPDPHFAAREFTARYHAAILAFVKSIVRDSDQAEEIVQDFVTTHVATGKLFKTFDRATGTFRVYLKQCLRNVLVDRFRREQRLALHHAEHPDTSPGGWDKVRGTSTTPDHDAAFLRGWTQSIVKMALQRVEAACRANDQEIHFRIFVGRHLANEEPPPSFNDLGRPYGLDGKTARSRATTVATQFRKVLRDLIAEEFGTDDKTDREIYAMLTAWAPGTES